MSHVEAVLSSATVTASGSFIFRPGDAPEVDLIYNIAGPFAAGSSLSFEMWEVDPADESTPLSDAVFTGTIDTARVGTLSLRLTASPTVKVVWSLTGTSVVGVTATVAKKEFPRSLLVKVADENAAPYTSALKNNTRAIAVESRELQMLLSQILTELSALRRQMVAITDEEDPL